MRRVLIRTSGLLGVVALLHNHPLSAQERFDISVYPYASMHRGEWELEGHINYTSRGTSGFGGTVAPTQGQWRFTAEVSRGLTDQWEFEPRARAGVDVSKALTLGFEWYGSFAETSQHHQYYPTADWRLGDDMTLHLGVGFGGASAGDRLVFKTRFEMPLADEK